MLYFEIMTHVDTDAVAPARVAVNCVVASMFQRPQADKVALPYTEKSPSNSVTFQGDKPGLTGLVRFRDDFH